MFIDFVRPIVRVLCTTIPAILVLASTAAEAADRSTAQFKSYAAEKLGGQLNKEQLEKFAKLVDKDGNGQISDSEFETRFAALERLRKDATRPERQPKQEADSTAKSKTRKPADARLAAPSDKAAVLLITGEKIADSWIPFAQWKTRNGKPTKIISVSQIAETYKADSVQEQIRQCVRDHIDNHGTRWVILGGDSLRGGKGLVPGGHTTVHAQEPAGIPTDIVYLSKTNWDADKDGVFGEFKDDREAVTYPDGTVGLGRIPVRTREDVAAFTDKVIAYESNYPTTEFAKQMIYTCTDSPAYPKVRRSWDDHVSKAWKGNVGRFFSQETPWDKGKPGSYPLSAENLVDLINGGTTGKLHIHGHGHLPVWVLERSLFTSKHVGQLRNDGAFPLITTVSCNTGEYDSTSDPSIVESMLRAPKAGSVAIVAPVRTGKPHFHKRSDFRLMVTEGKLDGTTHTMTRYWENGLGKGLTTGESLMKAKAAMIPDAQKTAGYHLCICELNLLGDPTLDMRPNVPRTPKLQFPPRVGTGKQKIEVATATPGCSVCLWKGREVYVTAVADATGKATIEVSCETAGELLVTAFGPSLNSVIGKIEVKHAEKSAESR